MIRIVNEAGHGHPTRFYDEDGRELHLGAYRVEIALHVDEINHATIHCLANELDILVLPENVRVYVNDPKSIEAEVERRLRLLREAE